MFVFPPQKVRAKKLVAEMTFTEMTNLFHGSCNVRQLRHHFWTRFSRLIRIFTALHAPRGVPYLVTVLIGC